MAAERKGEEEAEEAAALAKHTERLEVLKSRSDGMGHFGRIEVGAEVCLPYKDDEGHIVLKTGILSVWDDNYGFEGVARGYCWEMTYRFVGDKNRQYLGVVIDPPDSRLAGESYAAIADYPLKSWQVEIGFPGEYMMNAREVTNLHQSIKWGYSASEEEGSEDGLDAGDLY